MAENGARSTPDGPGQCSVCWNYITWLPRRLTLFLVSLVALPLIVAFGPLVLLLAVCCSCCERRKDRRFMKSSLTAAPTNSVNVELPAAGVSARPASRMRRMSLVSETMHALQEEKLSPVIHAALRFHTHVDVERLANVVQERIVAMYPPFRGVSTRRPDKPAYYWRVLGADEVHARDHIIRKELPGENVDREMEGFVGSILNDPLPENRPPWICYYVTYTNSPYCDLIWRIDHAIGDGITLAGVLLKLTDPIGDHTVKRRTKAAVSTCSRCCSSVWSALNHTYVFLSTVWAMPQLIFRTDTPNHVRSGTIGGRSVHKSFAHIMLPLDDIKLVAHLNTHTTVNDVIMAAATGGIRRYLQSRQDPIADHCCPLFRAGTIINIRQSRSTIVHDITELLKQPGGWGNTFSYMFIELPIQHAANPLQRVLAMNKVMTRAKRSPEPWFVYHGTRLLHEFAGAGVAGLFSRYIFSRMSVVFSNVFGPVGAVELAGTKLESVLNCLAPANVGLFFSCLSYNGRMAVCIASDNAVVSDPHAVLDEIREEMRLLRADAPV